MRECFQVLVNGETVQVGTGPHPSGMPTYRPLAKTLGITLFRTVIDLLVMRFRNPATGK